MALCFVSNKDLTVTHSDIAQRLKREGEEIVWLAPSRRWARWLKAEGWPEGDIVCLADHAQEWNDLGVDKALAELADLEDEAPATVSNVIRMCRFLSRSPSAFSYAYLAVARRHVEPFLRDRGVEAVFGEGTWGFELLTWMVSRRLGIPMLTPATTRVPGDRFYFSDAVTAEMVPVARPTEADRQWAADFLRGWLDRPVQPAYMKAHRRGYKAFRARWLSELAIGLLQPHLDRGDATLWPLKARIADRTKRFVNATACNLLRPFERGPSDERYVLYPLHHQPETSVDVYGSLNSNQVALIETVSRLLPATHKLWVKEHKGALGDRSIGWYRHICSLPNVRLIDPFEDIFGLMNKADLVVTICGTAGYEAALLGVPSLGLAPVFFAPLLTNQPNARSHPLEWRLRELLSSSRATGRVTEVRPAAVEFLANLYANSYVGNPGELGVPMERRSRPDHLEREAQAFSTFMSGLREASSRPR
jgi:hypothetical protein